MGATPAAFNISLDQYLQLDFDHLRPQMDELREFFFSVRLAQWAPFAGVVAVVRVRRGATAALLAGWLGAFIVVKGFNENGTSSPTRSGGSSCLLGQRTSCCSHRSRS